MWCIRFSTCFYGACGGLQKATGKVAIRSQQLRCADLINPVIVAWLPGAQDSIHWGKRSQAMTRVLKDQMLALCVGTICLVSLVWLELVA